MGRTRGEPDGIGLTPVGVKLTGSSRTLHLAGGEVEREDVHVLRLVTPVTAVTAVTAIMTRPTAHERRPLRFRSLISTYVLYDTHTCNDGPFLRYYPGFVYTPLNHHERGVL